MILIRVALLFLAAIWAMPQSYADDGEGEFVAINGTVLTEAQIAAVEDELDETLSPGNYVLDYGTGCWANLTTGEGECEIDDEAATQSAAAGDTDRPAGGHKEIVINGLRLSAEQIANLESHLGTEVVPGYYLVNPQDGCWINVTTGQSGCGVGGRAGSGEYATSGGSGDWNRNGDWSHYSEAAEGAVGGSGDGCVYAFGWSNC